MPVHPDTTEWDPERRRLWKTSGCELENSPPVSYPRSKKKVPLEKDFEKSIIKLL